MVEGLRLITVVDLVLKTWVPGDSQSYLGAKRHFLELGHEPVP
jgi:hypothetical protein